MITEHARVESAVTALARGDLTAVGKLLTASHLSSQRLFENSTAALDGLVDLLDGHPGVLGARLTGGGFGGAVMAFTTTDFDLEAATEIASRSGSSPDVMRFETADGAALLDPIEAFAAALSQPHARCGLT